MISLKKNILLSRFQRYIEKTIFVNHEYKRYESDRQMLQRIASKYTVLFFVILMFDTLLDWFLGLIDIVIHLILGVPVFSYNWAKESQFYRLNFISG